MRSSMKVMNKKYYIDKAETNRRNNRLAAYRIQFYNNQLVDKLVLNQDDNEYNRPTDAMLYANLEVLTRPSVYNNYNRLMNSKYIRQDSIQQLLVRNKANKDVNRIVEMELERVKNNLNFVEDVIRRYNVAKQEYQRLLDEQKSNSINNRRRILEEVVYKVNEVNRSEGLNIRLPEPYRNLDTFTESLLRENRMTSEYDFYREENRLSQEAGDGVLYNRKKWVWTGAGLTTRHESNNMQEVDFEDTFVILNDKTGDIDEINHPCDPNGSPSNCRICYCELEVF